MITESRAVVHNRRGKTFCIGVFLKLYGKQSLRGSYDLLFISFSLIIANSTNAFNFKNDADRIRQFRYFFDNYQAVRQ